MKFICLGYIEPNKFESMSERERNAILDECFTYDDFLRKNGHFAPERGVLSRRVAAGSGPLVARHWQVHAPCEAKTGNGHKLRSTTQAHRYSVLGYKGARRKRLA
jgi:hypothetical protein